MLKVPSFNRCVEELAKESALFVHDERPEQISVNITSWGFIQALNLRDADVHANEDYDEGLKMKTMIDCHL